MTTQTDIQSTYSTSQHQPHTQQNQTSKSNQKVALVVEGGGMRGIFSAGVLDSFYELGFDPFDLHMGVSAGSLNLISHLAGQYRRNYRVVMSCATSGQFINGWKYLKGGHYLDLDWLGSECMDLHPLDENAAFEFLKKTGKEYIVVCTNVETGQPIYFAPNDDNIHDVLLGSCSVPLLYRDPVYIDNIRVIDGGVSDPIPVRAAVEKGATTIIVIRSREKSYRKLNNFEVKLGSYIYRHYPEFKQTILNQHAIYNGSVDFIENPPSGINVFQIAPEVALGTGRTTKNTLVLEQDYQLGKQLGEQFVLQYQSLHSISETAVA